MKNFKSKIITIIFLLSLAALFWITGSRTPWNDIGLTASEEGIAVHLGDIPSENYDRMGFTKAVVRHVESENGWLVGTERGELFLFSSKGEQIWKRSLGIGKFISVCLSNDSQVAFVGEQSPAGNLYAIDVHTGDILWQYAAANFVGADPSKRSYPSIVHIVVDKNDNVYANAYRFFMNKDGSRGYNGRMLAINRSGELLWKYPAEESIDSWINWCDVNDNNGEVVISTSAYDFREDMVYKDTMYFLDKNTGEKINSVFIKPVEPFDNTVMRGSPNFSKDGKYLAAACSDGRGFLFDALGNMLWERTLSKPTQVDNVWINASGRDGYAVKEGVVFSTINTFNRENWQIPTPIEHPSNNSIFMFGYDGTFKYQYMADGTMEELSFAKDKVACAVGRNVRTHNYGAHGGLILNIADGRKLNFFHTEGPLQAINISSDGLTAAGVEAPAVTPDGKIIGAYRLHIWKLN